MKPTKLGKSQKKNRKVKKIKCIPYKNRKLTKWPTFFVCLQRQLLVHKSAIAEVHMVSVCVVDMVRCWRHGQCLQHVSTRDPVTSC